MAGGSLLPPEAALCVEACRVDRRPACPEAGRINPTLLLRLAAWHRVSAFLSENAAPLDLPPETRAPLRAATMATLHRNMQVLAETRRVLAGLSDEGVEAILLKGIHLLDAVYEHPGQRPMSDVDLMVLPVQARQAVAALQRLGYRADETALSAGLRLDGEMRLEIDAVHSLTVEVHTTLNRGNRHHWFDSGKIWERSVPYDLDGAAARVLSWPDTLVYLCVHAVPHAFCQVIWLRDIALVAERVNAEGGWDRLIAAAGEFRARRATAAGLGLAAHLLGASVPQRVFDALGGLSPAAAGPAAIRLIGRGRYSTTASLWCRLRLADSPRDALSELAGALVTKAARSPQLRRLTRDGA